MEYRLSNTANYQYHAAFLHALTVFKTTGFNQFTSMRRELLSYHW